MNMRVQIICGFLLVILLSNTHNVHADDKTINRLLNNQAIVSRQIMCVLEKSPCDQLGRQLKVFTPHAGPSAAYPDMGYMMDGQAHMMQRPPGDPGFHQGYAYYPPAEYYGHHL